MQVCRNTCNGVHNIKGKVPDQGFQERNCTLLQIWSVVIKDHITIWHKDMLAVADQIIGRQAVNKYVDSGHQHVTKNLLEIKYSRPSLFPIINIDQAFCYHNLWGMT